MKPAKLVHIAVRSDDPRRLADFYKRAFGVKEVLSNRRAIDLWDGYLFLAINPPSATGPKGLNHFGFFVEDVEALRPILSEAGASKVEARPAGRSFTDWRVHDPEGNPIDLSARGYNKIPDERLEKGTENETMCEVRRLVLLSSDPRQLSKFYETVFGMKTIQKSANKVVLTDGVMRLAILNLNPNPLTGLYCCGIAAHGDWNAKLRQLQDDGVSVSKESDWLDEDEQQLHLRDPEGNLVTVFGIN
jgi:catechol 2,3-dioxygenase-like lactoylglutathione lyase family enzyme